MAIIGAALEQLAGMEYMLFGRTGTLTTGRTQLVAIETTADLFAGLMVWCKVLSAEIRVAAGFPRVSYSEVPLRFT